MMEMNLVRNRKGLTLIEVILTITILGVAMLGITSMLIFGTKTFSKNITQSEVQSDTRYGMDFISSETKYASEMKILSAIPESFAEKKRYIYEEDGKLMHKTPGNEPVEVVAPNDSSSYAMSLEFKKGEKSEGKLLGVKMNEEIKAQDFFLETENELLNLVGEISEEDIKDKDMESGGVIEYSLLANSNRIVKFTFRKEDNSKVSDGWTADIDGSISGDTIRVWIPAKTSLKDLVASYVTTGKEVKIGKVVQKNGETSNDFTSDIVNYKVIAEDGSERTYKVIVRNHSETPPDAANVRIFTPEGVGWNDISLTGMYTYIANGNGKEGSSEYRWLKGNKLDGEGNIENPIEVTGAYKKDIVPKEHGVKDGYLQFEVKPVSETGAIGNWKSSNPVEIYESGNLLWRKIVGDLYYLRLEAVKKQEFDEDRKSNGLPKYEVKVKENTTVAGFDINADIVKNTLTVKGSGVPQGVHFSIDISDYVKDRTSYKVTFETHLDRTSGKYATDGWGITLNANVDEKGRDAGYLFQFDPGASGFVMRRDRFGTHHVFSGLGVKTQYNPSNIANDGFWWNGGTSRTNSLWYEVPFVTEITIQEQLDHTMIWKAVTWRKGEENKRSEEMWYGDFGKVSYKSFNFEGEQKSISANWGGNNANKSLYLYDPELRNGKYLGIRTWANTQRVEGVDVKDFKADFINLEVGDGFSMDIKEARFLDKNRVEIEFSQPLRNSFRQELVKLNGISVESIQEPNPSQKHKAVLNVSGVTDSMISSGLSGNSIERGAFRQQRAGDIKVSNGENFTIKAMSEN